MSFCSLDLLDNPEISEIPVERQIEVPLKRSQRETRPALLNDCILNLNESNYIIGPHFI